ncbi:glutaredoxin family protein [Glutamicibacter sp. MCAF14]|uniref:glutaredoxin family protein n=1 Tax=Glutamicibacter sp. MCAF14 TaxID=3233043 RepID=UPI003F8FB09D
MRIVTVYSKPSCGQCNMTKIELRKKGVQFEEINALSPGNEELAEAIRERANEKGIIGSFPYVTVYDEYNELIADWFGFIPDSINNHAAVSDAEDAA